MNLLITGGRVIDPKHRRDGAFDVLVKDGAVARVDKKIRPGKGDKTLDAKGRWVLPGFIDPHVHLREPGGEESETIESGSRAAAAGGVTSVLATANTKPVIDTPQQVRFVARRAKETAVVRVYPVGAVTKGLEGQELTDIVDMVRQGVKAVSDDGRCVMNSRLLRRALEHAKSLGIPLIEHCEDENLSLHGVMNEGELSVRLGLRGIPSESEAVIVARDAYLAKLTGAHVHCAHMSTRESIDILRLAKKQGVPVSGETCPHYFTLTETAVQRYNTLSKMKPPLRGHEDREAILEALADGTLDVIATDHAPHEAHSKAREFSQAPFGIIGLETSFALVYTELIQKKILSPIDAIRKMTENPARIFSLPGGDLGVGSPADIAIFDPGLDWTVREEDFFSKSGNSPFIGRKFKGKVVTTLVGGKVVFQNQKKTAHPEPVEG